MTFSITGQEKSDLLIQVTAWAGLTALKIKLSCKAASPSINHNCGEGVYISIIPVGKSKRIGVIQNYIADVY